MSERIFVSRAFVAQGWEHNVFKPISEEPSITLKTPRVFTHFTFLGRNPAVALRQELEDAKSLVSGTNVKIPRTMIYGFNKKFLRVLPIKGYVVGQQYIQEDHSVADIEQYLADQKLDPLVDEYRKQQKNFISSEGNVYWIDPTNGIVGRMITSLVGIDINTYRRLRHQFVIWREHGFVNQALGLMHAKARGSIANL